MLNSLLYNVNAAYIYILFVRRGLHLKNFGRGLVNYGLGFSLDLDTCGLGLDSITGNICTSTYVLTYLHKY